MPLFTVTMKANRSAKEKRLPFQNHPRRQALLLDMLNMIFSSASFGRVPSPVAACRGAVERDLSANAHLALRAAPATMLTV
jgi:hypothetical protein